MKIRGMRESLKLCVGGVISPLTHTLADYEVIFNQSDSMCLGLNGLLQVNLNPY